MTDAETWYLDLIDESGGVAALYWLTMWPSAGRSWLWVAAGCLDGEPVVMIDDAAPLPRSPLLEVRAPGVWADLVVESPSEHYSLGVEAFGVRLDAGAVPDAEPWGDRTPLGFDLEWEVELSDAAPNIDAALVHGELLLGDSAHVITGAGIVAHSSGPVIPPGGGWSSARDADGTWRIETDAPASNAAFPGLVVPLAGTVPDAGPWTGWARASVGHGWTVNCG